MSVSYVDVLQVVIISTIHEFFKTFICKNYIVSSYIK